MPRSNESIKVSPTTRRNALSSARTTRASTVSLCRSSAASVADAYLYVMLRWARMQGLEVPEPLPAFVERMEARPAVRLALQHEGLT